MAKIDKVFLKAMFIGLYTLKRIRETNDISTIDHGIKQLAKGSILFQLLFFSIFE